MLERTFICRQRASYRAIALEFALQITRYHNVRVDNVRRHSVQ